MIAIATFCGNRLRRWIHWMHRPPVRRWAARVLVLLQIAVVLLPLGVMHELARRNRINALHLDDWAYVPLYEKAVAGTLAAHDFFGGYLEHRPAVARVIAIVTTLATKGDVRAQPIVAFAAVAMAWLACGLLLRRGLGPWSRWWMPWGLMGGVLFCPVQWQEFLWPSCHMDTLPFLFLVLSLLVLGKESWPLWLRAGLCAAFAWTATYSFAAGLTLWVLVPVTVLCGYGFGSVRCRKHFLIAWGVPMGVTLFLYFHGLKNEVEPEFAYGQGHEDTMTHSVAAIIQSPWKGVRFVVTLLGANLARGLMGTREAVAQGIGYLLLALFTAMVMAVAARWKEGRLRTAALPFVTIGAYGACVAGMVAAGRAWASKGIGGALNNRYACFAAAFGAGLIGLIAVIRRFRGLDDDGIGPARPESPLVPIRDWFDRAVPVLGGVLGGLLTANWLYGANMMAAWHHARAREAADLHFAPLLGLSQDHGGPGMNIRLAVARAQTMDRLGFLHPPLAQSLDLSDFNIKGPPLDKRIAGLTGSEAHDRDVTISGFALLTASGQPADAILVTIDPDANGHRQIAGVTITDNLPPFWSFSTAKDLQYVVFDDNRYRQFGHWSTPLARASLPKGKLRVEAWALDLRRMTVREIPGEVWLKN